MFCGRFEKAGTMAADTARDGAEAGFPDDSPRARLPLWSADDNWMEGTF